MKILVVLALALVAVQANKAAWDQFKFHHGKNYKSIDEEVYRYRVFQNNIKSIEEHNKKYNQGLETYTKAVNQFGDLTPQEFLSLQTLQNATKPSKMGVYRAPLNGDLPSEVDWRSKGAVNKVRDQGDCGACWSFSAIGSLEGQYQIKNGKLLSFSEENLVDCTMESSACFGGQMIYAFEYIRDFGIETEENYPYIAYYTECHFNPDKSVLRIQGYKEIVADSESDLQSAVAEVGPISIGIEATDNFQFYSSGLFNDPSCKKQLNHGVLAVGYGRDYWLVKNSWGTTWGENGYVRMARNKNNQCGIASKASYPVL